MRIAVVGAFVLDCIVNVASVPPIGQDVEAREIHTSPGGKALNLSVAISRLGGEVAAVGVVGEDGPGSQLLDALRAEGVNTDSLHMKKRARTPICVCLVDGEGATSFIYKLDDAAGLDEAGVESARSVLRRVDAVVLTFEVPVPAVHAVLRVAQESGTPVVVQPAPPLSNPEDARLLPWEAASLVVPNEAEARSLLHGDPAAAVPSDQLASYVAQALGVERVVVTLGAGGCVVHSEGRAKSYSALEPSCVVDTTGASDAFTAALTLCLARGASEPDGVDVGLAAASLAIERPGGLASMPDLASLTARLGGEPSGSASVR